MKILFVLLMQIIIVGCKSKPKSENINRVYNIADYGGYNDKGWDSLFNVVKDSGGIIFLPYSLTKGKMWSNGHIILDTVIPSGGYDPCQIEIQRLLNIIDSLRKAQLQAGRDVNIGDNHGDMIINNQ